MLDNSASIGSDGFEKSKNFITNIAEYFNPETTRVGLIDFSNVGIVRIPFALNRKSSELKALVKEIKYGRGKEHSIAKAYQRASSYFSERRMTGKTFLILVTAAQHTDVAKHSTAFIGKLALQQQGVRLYVIGAGNKVSESKLGDYSSGSMFTFKADDFDDVIGFVTKLRKNICSLAR